MPPHADRDRAIDAKGEATPRDGRRIVHTSTLSARVQLPRRYHTWRPRPRPRRTLTLLHPPAPGRPTWAAIGPPGF
ncbi:hypothetical protein EYF80_065115 [Liparis tanakae]|uniref:Uncharacterized protein n=1 Tax=Liparis tanakae TaxID=230148 RepID=A0A4Z2E7J7_9TELE|nr:hypothetical protein EYF80_065115 [Liparis tanakae]